MYFSYSQKGQALREKLIAFIDEHVYPNESVYHEQLEAQANRFSAIPPILEELKLKAQEADLWNLFLPDSMYVGLTNLEYAPLFEIMGRSLIAPQILNTKMSKVVIERRNDYLLNATSLQRLGSENDLKGVALFLASASNYVTGDTIVVDGGMAAMI